MFGLKILVSEKRILFDQLFEDVVTNAPLARRRTDASIFERLRYATGYASINSRSARGFVAEIFTLEKGRHDSRFLVARLSLANPHAFGFRQANADAWCG